MSCDPICIGRMVLSQSWQLQGRRRSQWDVRRRLQALPRSPFLGAAAALVCAPVRVVPQICIGRKRRGWLSYACPPRRRLGPSHPPPPRSHPVWVQGCSGEAQPAAHREEQQLQTTSLWDPVPRLFQCPAPYHGTGADAVVPLRMAFSMGQSPADVPHSQRRRWAEKPRRVAKSGSPRLHSSLTPSPTAPTLPTEDSPHWSSHRRRAGTSACPSGPWKEQFSELSRAIQRDSEEEERGGRSRSGGRDMRQGREHSVPLLHRVGKCYRWVWSPRWDLALQLQADSPLQPPCHWGSPRWHRAWGGMPSRSPEIISHLK